MGITKTEGFTSHITEMAVVFKAIGHPARLAILELLAQSPSCICKDIVDEIPLAQPTVSRHLAELKRAGLIQGTIEGKNVCYCINPSRWHAVKGVVDRISSQISNNTICCE